MQSGLGRRAQRSGDALPQAAAEAEGGASAKQRQRTWSCRSRCGWWADECLNRLTGAVKGPGTDQARSGEAEACEGLAIKCGAADDWSGLNIIRINGKY